MPKCKGITSFFEANLLAYCSLHMFTYSSPFQNTPIFFWPALYRIVLPNNWLSIIYFTRFRWQRICRLSLVNHIINFSSIHWSSLGMESAIRMNLLFIFYPTIKASILQNNIENSICFLKRGRFGSTQTHPTDGRESTPHTILSKNIQTVTHLGVWSFFKFWWKLSCWVSSTTDKNGNRPEPVDAVTTDSDRSLGSIMIMMQVAINDLY